MLRAILKVVTQIDVNLEIDYYIHDDKSTTPFIGKELWLVSKIRIKKNARIKKLRYCFYYMIYWAYTAADTFPIIIMSGHGILTSLPFLIR